MPVTFENVANPKFTVISDVCVYRINTQAGFTVSHVAWEPSDLRQSLKAGSGTESRTAKRTGNIGTNRNRSSSRTEPNRWDTGYHLGYEAQTRAGCKAVENWRHLPIFQSLATTGNQITGSQRWHPLWNNIGYPSNSSNLCGWGPYSPKSCQKESQKTNKKPATTTNLMLQRTWYLAKIHAIRPPNKQKPWLCWTSKHSVWAKVLDYCLYAWLVTCAYDTPPCR